MLQPMNPPIEVESPGSGASAGGEPRAPTTRRLSDLSKTITMAQIAKAAGVSQGAISSLLNDRDYGIRVSDRTRERVFRVCREMGYLPNDLRAVVRMYPELGEFALLIGRQPGVTLDDPFIARIAAAAMRAVPDPSRPISFAFYDEGSDYTQNPDLLPQPVRTGVASKLIGYGPPNAALLQIVNRRGLPFISLGQEIKSPGVISIVPDFLHAAQLAFEAFAKSGRQRIAIASGPFGTSQPAILEMNRGVRMAADRLGISIEAHNIIYGDLSFAAGLAACDALLSRKEKPAAVFCMSDAIAAGVIARAQASGVRIPGDLSVIGCGDDPIAVQSLPEIATIHLPAEEMARAAVAESDRRVREPVSEEPEKKVIAVKLVARGSLASSSKR